jgi:hypothetical protein
MHDRHWSAMPQVTAVDEQFGPHTSPLLRTSPSATGPPVSDLSYERIRCRPVLGGLINEYERAA